MAKCDVGDIVSLMTLWLWKSPTPVNNYDGDLVVWNKAFWKNIEFEIQ